MPATMDQSPSESDAEDACAEASLDNLSRCAAAKARAALAAITGASPMPLDELGGLADLVQACQLASHTALARGQAAAAALTASASATLTNLESARFEIKTRSAEARAQLSRSLEHLRHLIGPPNGGDTAGERQQAHGDARQPPPPAVWLATVVAVACLALAARASHTPSQSLQPRYDNIPDGPASAASTETGFTPMAFPSSTVPQSAIVVSTASTASTLASVEEDVRQLPHPRARAARCPRPLRRSTRLLPSHPRCMRCTAASPTLCTRLPLAKSLQARREARQILDEAVDEGLSGGLLPTILFDLKPRRPSSASTRKKTYDEAKTPPSRRSARLEVSPR